MLVARRDPPFESGAHDNSRPLPLHHVHLPQHSRFMTALQVVATLVGIPVGLASAYSIYHSNFTDEARCVTLRANIVAMLDKSADATTLRMLARKDVASFETTCGAVDPDAVAAFWHLLAVKTAAPAAAPPPQAAPEPAKIVAEPVKAVPAPKPAAIEAKPVRPEAKAVEAKPSEPKPPDAKAAAGAAADENWVASVRAALTHAPARDEAAEPAAPAAPPRRLGKLPVVSAPPAEPAAPAVSAPAASTAVVAPPALPAPVPIAAAPAPAAADHPVPPGEIPDAPPAGQPAETPHHSWMSKVPILNRVVGD